MHDILAVPVGEVRASQIVTATYLPRWSVASFAEEERRNLVAQLTMESNARRLTRGGVVTIAAPRHRR
jgi:hypothetical protein